MAKSSKPKNAAADAKAAATVATAASAPGEPASGGPVASEGGPRVGEATSEAVLPATKAKPSSSLKGLSIVVTSLSPKGRRRAGYAFTREPTTIPVRLLSESEYDAIVGDPALAVSEIEADVD